MEIKDIHYTGQSHSSTWLDHFSVIESLTNPHVTVSCPSHDRSFCFLLVRNKVLTEVYEMMLKGQGREEEYALQSSLICCQQLPDALANG